jgi:hypothetical protein
VRRYVAMLVLAAGALLLTPGATGFPDVPGDPTPPVVTPIISGNLGLQGWYVTNVTLSWSIVDPESLILETVGCDTKTFTADTVGTTRTCTAVSDGGTTTVSKTIKLDKTAPQNNGGSASRPPDSNGWYNHALTITFSGSDATSGIDTCTQVTYSVPDDPSASVSGFCKDVAGNQSVSSPFGFQFDKTAPQVSSTPDRAPNGNGWFRAPVTVTFDATDATSGKDVCDAPKVYSGPDSGNASVSGSCSDKAGNSASKSLALKYDATAPQVSSSPDRAPNGNGWYRAPVTVTFDATDATSGKDVCDAPKVYSGPDNGNASVSGSCSDKAGNSASKSLALKYDATAPQVTNKVPSRGPDANGWYNHPLTVTFQGADATSGVDSCTQAGYWGPDSGDASVSGSCTDKAGNQSASSSFQLKYDATAPQVTSTPDRTPNGNGWYRAPVTVTFDAADATSGKDVCDAPKVYSGPDSGNASVSGSCTDKAGNGASKSFGLKYDATVPQVTSTPDRAPNANGWYRAAVTVTFDATDATSGKDVCDAPKTYSGPDSGEASVSGSCTDKAGNSASKLFGLKYDATAPQVSSTPDRGPNANGWYRAAVTVTFDAADATSGKDVCDAPKTYSGPDSGNASVSGSCSDKAGNNASKLFGLKYDATAPVVSSTPDRAPNGNGWYRAPVTVTFDAADATSGKDVCDAPKVYSGPDSGNASVSGSCSDKAGNSASKSLPFKYDATNPVVTAAPGRNPDANGWYNHSLTVTFDATDATSGKDVCDAPKTYSGPDSGNASVSGSCSDKAGNSASKSLGLKYDATAPQVTAAPSRSPDANGWYNHLLTVTFTGGDATSGLDSCVAPKSYGGPDSDNASVSGSCSDVAGNTGSKALGFKYDGTAPVVTGKVPSRGPDANGWYNHSLTVTFQGSDATSGIDACTQAAYSGPDSANASVTGSCVDEAANVSASSSFQLKYDATAPQVSSTPDRAPNANGWYRAAVTVTFDATDATSGKFACDPAKVYSGPDSGDASVSGSCSDNAGNSASKSFGLKYDATNPQVTAVPGRSPDANGWYNHALTVTFDATDATSGKDSCTAPQTYSGPDNADASVSGSCSDKAGNSASKSLGLKYDATKPQVSATPSRSPDTNGWYRASLTVTFDATDATSGKDSCSAPKGYSGPDNGGASVGGSCSDKAGNTATRAFVFGYDATAPQNVHGAPARPPDANGWYSDPLDVDFDGDDATSGIDACTQLTYAGPDDDQIAASGSCTDMAGNNASGAFGFKYDATAPVVTQVIPVRAPDRGPWYNRPIAFAAQGVDATAGIDSCPATMYDGPDRADATVAGACLDKAGNVGVKAAPLSYDATGPQVTVSPTRAPDVNGWYNQPVDLSFSGSDAVSGLASCGAPERYSGPDNASAAVVGTCHDHAGNAGAGSLPLRYDATAPQVTGGQPDRAPDANGWYRRPVTIGFVGADAVSQIAVCTQASYGGPDAAQATVSGSCRDHAGNTSGVAAFGLKYDATAPSVSGLTAKAGNRSVELTWAASADASRVEIVRTAGARALKATVYRGVGRTFTDTGLENGVRHRYEVTAYDAAENRASSAVEALPQAPLLGPAAGAKVSAPPLLAWKAVEGATYYNVQVWRKRRVLSMWPSGTSLRLKQSWKYKGRRYHLSPGRYRWYVWPGLGRRAQERYGRLIGSSSFVVVPKRAKR